MQDFVSLDEINQETSVPKAEWTKANTEKALKLLFPDENKEKRNACDLLSVKSSDEEDQILQILD